MNAKTKTPPNTENSDLTGELRARVPQWMADSVVTLANERIIAGKRLTGADIVREAVSEYLGRHKKTA